MKFWETSHFPRCLVPRPLRNAEGFFDGTKKLQLLCGIQIQPPSCLHQNLCRLIQSSLNCPRLTCFYLVDYCLGFAVLFSLVRAVSRTERDSETGRVFFLKKTWKSHARFGIPIRLRNRIWYITISYSKTFAYICNKE